MGNISIALLAFIVGALADPTLVFAQQEGMAAVLIDGSDSMGRIDTRENKQVLTIVIDSVVTNILFNGGLPGVPQHTYFGMRVFGARRTGGNRSCVFPPNNLYYGAGVGQSLTFTNQMGYASVSDWTAGGYTQGIAMGILRTALNGLRGKASDTSMLGKALVDTLTTYKRFPFGRKRIMLITDGGESCGKEGSASPRVALSAKGLSRDPNLTLWIVLYQPLSQKDVDRFTGIVADVNAANPLGGNDQSRLLVANRQSELDTITAAFRTGHLDVLGKFYDPCAQITAVPNVQSNCDCCTLSGNSCATCTTSGQCTVNGSVCGNYPPGVPRGVRGY